MRCVVRVGLAVFVIALAGSFNGFVVGMAIGGLGFGLYTAVELALVADVLRDPASAAKDLGVMNIAGHSHPQWHPRSRRPSWRSAAAATACCTRWLARARYSAPAPSSA